MKAIKLLACIALSGCCLMTLSETAEAAPGVVLDKTQLPAGDRASLEREVSKAKTKSPKVFEQVAKSPDLAIEADENKRGTYASITRQLAALGPQAVVPMLEMLAIDGSPRGKMSEGAWLTLRVSLIEAVGRLRDPRSRPVMMAIIKNTSEFEIVRAAVESLGRLGDDKAANHLVTAVKRGGDKQLAILGGIGECRRAIVADTLAAMAAKRPTNSARAVSLIKALGAVGNSWAWQTPDVKKSGEGAKVRSTAAKALLGLYLAYDGELREKAAKAILIVNDPSTPALIENAKQGASAELVTALDMLAARVAQNPVR